MTPNERKTMEAVIALLKPHTPWEELALHLATLRAALDADRAPRECDPYAGPQPGSIADYALRAARSKYVTERPQQYDADPPQEPGRQTPEASMSRSAAQRASNVAVVPNRPDVVRSKS